MEYTPELVQHFFMIQCQKTVVETANLCALMCDTNRGHLSVGDLIRKKFNVDNFSTNTKVEPSNPDKKVPGLKLVHSTNSTKEKIKSVAKLTVVKKEK